MSSKVLFLLKGMPYENGNLQASGLFARDHEDWARILSLSAGHIGV
jgi:hypothetical protein